MWSQEQVVKHLESVEAAAEDVLSDRHQIVDLVRKQNGLREARSCLHKRPGSQLNEQSVENRDRCWTVSGNTFIKLPVHNVDQLLSRDSRRIDGELQKLRQALPDKVDRLNRLEMKAPLKGFNLKPLSRAEMSAMNQVLGK